MSSEKIKGESPPGYDGKGLNVVERPEEGYMEQTARRKSSAVDPEILNGEIYDERFQSTKRGLKSRHAQMIALGVFWSVAAKTCRNLMLALRRHHRHRSLRRLRPDTSYWRSCVHPGILHCHVLPCMVHRDRYYGDCSVPPNQRLHDGHVWLAICLQEFGIRYGLAVLVFARNSSPIRSIRLRHPNHSDERLLGLRLPLPAS
jgi:hypothetical protein